MKVKINYLKPELGMLILFFNYVSHVCFNKYCQVPAINNCQQKGYKFGTGAINID